MQCQQDCKMYIIFIEFITNNLNHFNYQLFQLKFQKVFSKNRLKILYYI